VGSRWRFEDRPSNFGPVEPSGPSSEDNRLYERTLSSIVPCWQDTLVESVLFWDGFRLLIRWVGARLPPSGVRRACGRRLWESGPPLRQSNLRASDAFYPHCAPPSATHVPANGPSGSMGQASRAGLSRRRGRNRIGGETPTGPPKATGQSYLGFCERSEPNPLAIEPGPAVHNGSGQVDFG
jgi:hypothetical protein